MAHQRLLWALALLLVVGVAPLHGEEQHQHFSFLSEPLDVRIPIRVVTIGFAADGALWDYPTAQLVADLRRALPHLDVHTETADGLASGPTEAIGVRFVFDWQAQTFAETPSVLDYELLVAGLVAGQQAGLQPANGRERCTASVRVDQQIERFIKPWIQFADEYTLVLLHPSVYRLGFKLCAAPAAGQPGRPLSYHYTSVEGSVGFGSWVGPERYAVVDFSSSGWGPLGSSRGGASAGATEAASVPQTHVDGEQFLRAFFVNKAKTAAQYLFAPGLRFAPAHVPPRPARTLLVALVSLSDHADADPIARLHQPAVNQLLHRLHGQNFQVVHGYHSLHDHKHLAIAVAKSLRVDLQYVYQPHAGTFAAVEQPYIDSRVLLEQLAATNDLLAHLPAVLQDRDVLPVYLLSLRSLPPNVTFSDQPELPFVATNGRFAVVLAHPTVGDAPVTLPFLHRSGQHIYERPLDALTKNVVTALLLSYGGAGFSLPFRAVKQQQTQHNADQQQHSFVYDWTWATGSHPFGPFTNFSSYTAVSQIFVDAPLRNRVLAQLSVCIATIRRATRHVEQLLDEFLFDRFGERTAASPSAVFWLEQLSHLSSVTASPAAAAPSSLSSSSSQQAVVARIHDELRKFERKLTTAAELLSSHRYADADQLASSLGFTADTFEKFVVDQVATLRVDLLCCDASRQLDASAKPADAVDNVEILRLVATSFLFFFFCFLLARAFFVQQTSALKRHRKQ